MLVKKFNDVAPRCVVVRSFLAEDYLAALVCSDLLVEPVQISVVTDLLPPALVTLCPGARHG